MGGATMAARLGNVLYLLGCIVAVLIVELGVLVLIEPGWFSAGNVHRLGVIITCAAMALVAWLIGRACRYVLAGT